MKISYLINKIINKFEIYSIRKFKVLENFYCLNKIPVEVRSIGFYFPNYQMMHHGDHLFFEPMMRFLRDQGYDVFVKPIKSMEFYFRELGYEIGSDGEIFSTDLIISKVEWSTLIRRKYSAYPVLMVETADNSIGSPLCDDLILKISKILGIKSDNFNSQPSMIHPTLSPQINAQIEKNAKYYLFNNYLDSGFFRLNFFKKRKLLYFMKTKKKSENILVIHTGSKLDLENDPKQYDFVDIDLRGKTSLSDIFSLVSNDSVIGNVSYDAFQMHLFFMVQKKSFIKFRGRFLLKNEKFVKDYINPPFQYNGNLNELIEYL